MLNALVPVFAVILLGYILKRSGFPGRDFWIYAERITYYLFFPGLLLSHLSVASFTGNQVLPLALVLILSISAISLVLFMIRPLLDISGPSFSSLFQGGIRMNTYVGLAGSAALFGDAGLTLAAVAMVSMIPLINLICVPTVIHFGRGNGCGRTRLILEIVKNPLILGCIGGFILNLSRLPLPPSFMHFLEILGRAALPLGLLAVGAGLEFKKLGESKSGLVVSSVSKLILLPALAMIICSLLNVEGTARAVAIIFTALPTAASSYILARQLGGDKTLMASIITTQTILAALTLLLMLYLGR